MLFFLAVASTLLLCISAQTDLTCGPQGVPAGTERMGVQVAFIDAEVVCNNLGGLGPDSDCPAELRYSNIGTDFGMSTGPEDDFLVDLVVTNLTEYRANEPERNGRTEQQTGQFGQVNLVDDFETDFRYAFVRAGGSTSNPDDQVIFTTPFDFFFYDIDVGENMRLTESLKFFPPALDVTTVNEACSEGNQPTPCLMTTVLVETFSDGSINATATDRGVGEDNPESPDQVLQPVAEMNDFERFAATRYVRVRYPPGINSFTVRYKITAAAVAGDSGRNFQLSVQGGGEAREIFAPCYYCDTDTLGDGAQCEPCGGGGGIEDVVMSPPCVLDPLNPQELVFAPDCALTEARVCSRGVPGSTFPECLSACASNCEANAAAVCRAPPAAPPMMFARKDPHLYLPHGGRADFRGAHNRTFAMLSAKDVAFNVLIEEADFNWAKRLVHGTKMAAAYWVVRTSTGKLLTVEYNATSRAAVVHEKGHRDVSLKDAMPTLVVDNVQISLEQQTLTVLIAKKWKLAATAAAFPFGNRAANKDKRLLDISIQALYDADHDVVAPHGIFGQAYDGDDVGVSGKIDKNRDAESITEAQAEGAIEGTWVDYMLETPFSTDFKYSRFDATSAKPRDVSKLAGKKTQAGSDIIVGATDLPSV